jgi:hypothetical protein
LLELKYGLLLVEKDAKADSGKPSTGVIMNARANLQLRAQWQRPLVWSGRML